MAADGSERTDTAEGLIQVPSRRPHDGREQQRNGQREGRQGKRAADPVMVHHTLHHQAEPGQAGGLLLGCEQCG
jgi:hypothetical protein